MHQPFCARLLLAVKMMRVDRKNSPAPVGPLSTITALPIAACSPNAYCSFQGPGLAVLSRTSSSIRHSVNVGSSREMDPRFSNPPLLLFWTSSRCQLGSQRRARLRCSETHTSNLWDDFLHFRSSSHSAVGIPESLN